MRTVLYMYMVIVGLSLSGSLCGCNASGQQMPDAVSVTYESAAQAVEEIIPGAERIALYFPQIRGQRVALVANHTSHVQDVHLVDTLLQLGVNVSKIFTPEHGFRGSADAGERIDDTKDARTDLPIVSLYGSRKKPSKADLADVDIVVFDIQDVGVRFYTYISTLHYVMEACAENDVRLIVLDRPNPNGHYVDGPVLDTRYRSFVGMHAIPVVYGMTMGELAQMINGEGWLDNAVRCDLQVIACKGYDHRSFYELPIKPSPNLPDMRSILLYPSLCFFEGTTMSVGRGTSTPFQVVGHPDVNDRSFSFTPRPNDGAKNPKHNGETCYGTSFRERTIGSLHGQTQLDLSPVMDYYRRFAETGQSFFLDNNFFDKLAGTPFLKLQIVQGLTEETIRKTWQADIEAFKAKRKNYLLYTDFE